jgi:DNA-binding NarL/FixJ family response regulator
VKKARRAFSSLKGRHGHLYRMLPDMMERVQKKLDSGQSNYSIAKEEGLSEGSIRYGLKQGYLKKRNA